MKEKKCSKQSSKKLNKGFTLIELLVVVIIIGILAAIALPQYQLARDKAQFANFKRLVKSIKTAFDDYYLVNNEYPNSFEGLEVDFSAEHVSPFSSENCVIFNDSYCCLGKQKEGLQEENIVCARNDYLFAYVFYNNVYSCVAKNGQDRAKRLCESFDFRNKASLKLFTPVGHDNNDGQKYTYYKLR